MLLVYFQSLKGESQSEIFFVSEEPEYQVFFTLEFLNQLNCNFLVNKKCLSIVPTVSNRKLKALQLV